MPRRGRLLDAGQQDVPQDNSRRTKWRSRMPVADNDRAPGIAGREGDPGLIWHRPALAGFQNLAKQDLSLRIADLHPGFGRGGNHQG